MKQQAWHIYRIVRGYWRIVDTVFYNPGIAADEIERSEADYYGGEIRVRKPR